MRRGAIFALVLAGTGGLFSIPQGFATRHIVADVMVPPLTGELAAGATLFARYCSACHGAKADGTEQGPPLVHRIYEPGHHADAAFYLAARRGVRAHHWNFGNMPPVEGISDDEIGKIVAFVRAVQIENGIE